MNIDTRQLALQTTQAKKMTQFHSANCVFLLNVRRAIALMLLTLASLCASTAWAQVTFVSSSSADGDGISSLVIARPAGIQVGDLLVGYIATEDNNAGIAGPAGWTKRFEVNNGNDVDFALFYKVADAADTNPGSFTFTMANDEEVIGAVLVYRGVDTASPVVGHATATGSSGTAVTPNVNAGADVNLMVIRGVSYHDNQSSLTPPAGTTLRIDRNRNGKKGANLGVADAQQAAGGNTGTANFTGADNRAYVASTFVIRSPQQPIVTVNLSTLTVAPVGAPGTAVYRVVVTNTDTPANQTATGVEVFNTLPTGFTYASSSIGTSGSCDRTSTSNPTVGQSTISWGTWDMAENCVITIDYTVDISLDSPLGVISDDIAVSGTNFTTVTDDGSATDEDVTVVCDEANISNTGTVTLGIDDIDPTNNSSSVCVVYIPNPRLVVEKSSSPNPIRRGETLVYTLSITNESTVLAATNVVLDDDLPASLTWVSTANSNGGGTCTASDLTTCNCSQPGNTGTVECQMGTLGTGETKTVMVTTIVD